MLIKGSYNVDGQDSFVESYDFSRANLNQENRVNTVTTVASICYNNPKAIGSESLFNRLQAEANGLPSSAYEFIPVLIKSDDDRFDPPIDFDVLKTPSLPSIIRYCELVYNGDAIYILTNYRSLVYDVESGLLPASVLDIYNTEEECAIIKKHFKVYKFRVDLSTRAQMVRHRVNWQELSRRYVSGKRVPFQFYISEKMKTVTSVNDISGADEEFTTQQVIDICLVHYYAALEAGVKPQEARRIIPQAMYTDIWGAFMPIQLENFYTLRLDDVHAQREINLIAKAMKSFEVDDTVVKDSE